MLEAGRFSSSEAGERGSERVFDAVDEIDC